MESVNPAATDEFFAALRADHARLEAQLQELDLVATGRSQDTAALAIVAATLRFIAGEGARHEEIEERTLLPRLRNRPEFRQILAAIEFQHRMNATEGRALADCAVGYRPDDARELRRLAGRFADANRGHMIAEERALFPLAASTLPPAVGAEMTRERLARATSERRAPGR